MRIIVVDDEQWIVTGLVKIIDKRFPQHEVQSFTDPNDALATMQTMLPDLLITDIRMDQMDGMTLISKVRELGLKHYAVLTGLEEVPLLQEGIRLQLTDYLIKPVNKTELYALIERVDAKLSMLNKSEVLEQLRLAAQYNETLSEVCLHTAYRAFSISEKQPPEGTDHICIEHHGKQLTLCFYDRETNDAQCQPIDPARLYAAVCAYCGDGQNDAQVLACLLRNEEKEQLAGQLPLFLKQSECAPDALMEVCRSAGRQLYTWEAVRLSARLLQGNEIDTLMQLPPCVQAQSEAVSTILAWIDEHYMEDIGLSEAAAKVFLQANYLTTLFKKETGIGFVQYLNQKRVDAACRELLKKKEVPLNDIAQRAGFTASRHFFNTFKRYTGLTPGEFRQQAMQDGFVN